VALGIDAGSDAIAKNLLRDAITVGELSDQPFLVPSVSGARGYSVVSALDGRILFRMVAFRRGPLFFLLSGPDPL
jgi:hypothetical protein